MSLINLQTLGLPISPSFVSNNDLSGIAGALFGRPATPSPATPSSGATPGGGAFSTIYAFGDSLSDAGNIYNLTLRTVPAGPYAQGHFTNGPVWVQDLAVKLGLPAPQPSTAGGTDFAFGGAETGPEGLHAQNPADLPSQYVQFAISHPAPEPNALYTVWIGSNDVFDAAAAYATDPAAAIADVSKAVANETGFIASLAAHGAHNLLVMNVPDLGLTPAETARGPQAAQAASSLSALYDTQLAASLADLTARDHLNLHLVDTYALLDQGVANPAAANLTNVTTPIWTGNYHDPGSGVLNASGAAQNGYLFFDSIHPSAAAHAILASVAYDSLVSAA
jgi:phospholipase/lecithinase/hemolysin